MDGDCVYYRLPGQDTKINIKGGITVYTAATPFFFSVFVFVEFNHKLG